MKAAIASLRDTDPQALLDRARSAWREGRRDAAVRRWRMAVATAPALAAPYVNLAGAEAGAVAAPWIEAAAAALAVDDPVVARNLGVLAQGRGSSLRAARCLRRSLVLAPDRAASLRVFAKIPEAEPADDPHRWWVRATVADPTSDASWVDLLKRLLSARLFNSAAQRAEAIPIAPRAWSSELLALVSHVFTRTARDAAALPLLDLLLERDPLQIRARSTRAALYRRTGDPARAVREARRAVLLAPDGFDALGSLATELAHADDYDRSTRLFRRCLLIAPDRRADILENFGAGLIKMPEGEEAGRVLREALVLKPTRAHCYMSLSSLGFQAQDLAYAGRYGRFSMIANHRLADARYNLAVLRRHQGRVAEARALFEEASALAPERPTYRFARALLELGDGDPVDGLRRYESRWDVPSFSSWRKLGDKPTLPLPVWRGEPLPDATLAVWGEQGVGDELWFAGYLDWAVRRVGRVVLEVAAGVAEVLQRAYPTIDVRVRARPETDAAMAAADLQIPIGGILPLCGAGAGPVPTGYVVPDPDTVAGLRARYAAGRQGVRVIGLSWRSVKPVRLRSFEAPLDQWGPVFALADTVFVSLQYGDVGQDARLVRDRFGVELVVDEDIDAYRNLAGLANQVAAVDAVVSIANSTVAMAHAVGRPVGVAARIVQDDWRYARLSPTTRWLPTAHCAWQTEGGDWSAPLADLAAWLQRGR